MTNPSEAMAQHLLRLLAPPFTYHMWPHVEWRANQLADDFPEMPAIVKAEYDRLKANALALRRSSPSSVKPAEPLPMAALVVMPARTRTAPQKRGTSRQSSSLLVGG